MRARCGWHVGGECQVVSDTAIREGVAASSCIQSPVKAEARQRPTRQERGDGFFFPLSLSLSPSPVCWPGGQSARRGGCEDSWESQVAGTTMLAAVNFLFYSLRPKWAASWMDGIGLDYGISSDNHFCGLAVLFTEKERGLAPLCHPASQPPHVGPDSILCNQHYPYSVGVGAGRQPRRTTQSGR